MLKAIIFDFFDVVRSDPYNAWLKNSGYEREGSFLEASQRLDSGQIDLGNFFELLSSLSGQPADDIAREFEAVTKVDSEVLTVIERLRRHYRIGLLSNSPSELIRGILRENDLHTYFDEIVISSEVGRVKPSEQIFAIILERLGADSSEVLFIDDNAHHIEGAEKAGISSILFESAEQLSSELHKRQVVLD